MNNPLISVIVPIYNAEQYLDQCICSILSQTYHELEVLLINDGSFDASEQICQKWAQDDQRVRYISQDNSGVSVARNIALQHARGKYITFVDADDFLCETFIQQMLKISEKNNVDIVYCGEEIFFEDGSCQITCNNDAGIYIWKNTEYEYCRYKAHRTVWGAIYKKDVIENLSFQEDIYVGEDSIFFAQVVRYANRIAYYDKALYYYRVLSASAYHGQFDEKKYTELEAWRRICCIFEDWPLAKLSAHTCLIDVCIQMIQKYLGDLEFDKSIQQEVVDMFKSNIWFAVKYDVLKRKNSMKHILKACFPSIYITYLKSKKYWKK